LQPSQLPIQKGKRIRISNNILGMPKPIKVGETLKLIIMTKTTSQPKPSRQPNHQADIKNPNKGTSGTNKTYDQNQGNRGKQLNPNQKSN
jgi:hypothetical protein